MAYISDIIMIITMIFMFVGAIDKIRGNKWGYGAEFENGILATGPLILAAAAIMAASPAVASVLIDIIKPFFQAIHVDPSLFPAMLLCSDMGGYSIAMELAAEEVIGLYNGLVVSAIMGATFTFMIPLGLIMLEESDREILVAGVLTGICCSACVILLTAALIFQQVTGICFPFFENLVTKDSVSGMMRLDQGLLICGQIGIVLAGAFPMILWISRVCQKPLKRLGAVLIINEQSVTGFLASATNYAAGFGCFKNMDTKGKYLNVSFLVSGGCVLGDLLGFTAGVNSNLLLPMIIGKLSAGITALLLAHIMAPKMLSQFVSN